MPNLKYVLQRMAGMDYGAMVRTAQQVHQRCGKNTLAALVDMTVCGFRYQAGYMDYLVFEFYRLNSRQRATYITRGKNNAYVHKLNPHQYWHLLEDKVEFLQRFDGLHGRDWIDLRQTDEAGFLDFIRRHPKFVGKPVSGTCGRGIEFFEISPESRVEGLYQMLRSAGQVLVEELIVQHPMVNHIYPLSVNTLRLVTIRVGEQVHLVFSCMRIGNGKRVDNLNSGGMAVLLDLEKGELCSPGADKDGKAYFQHPMTGTDLIGAPVPFCHEARQLVTEAALRVPELGYIGWDVAVTEKGPILVEANQFPGHDIYQFQVHLGPDRIGLAPRFEEAMGGL